MTGIELTDDGCVLVDVREGMVLPQLAAVVVIEPPFWPPSSLAAIRRRKHFSSLARVVAWNPDESMFTALTEAGFTIETTISPERALAIVSAEREHGPNEASVYAALSRRGAVFAIVRRGEVLYSRRVEWRYKHFTRPKPLLLQRYVFVSQLAPEIQQGVRVVGKQLRVRVDSVVLCGDLPDLRLLGKALAEELNLKVETLDSLDDLDVTPSAMADRALDYAPALRLAAAVTSLPPGETPRRGRWFGRTAATFAFVIGVLLAGRFRPFA
jgi:hypothetical protein